MYKSSDSGFLMIEAIIGIAITAVFALTFTTVITHGVQANRFSIERTKAELYLTELIEIAKDLEASNWEELADANCTENDPCSFAPDTVSGDQVWLVDEDVEELEDGEYERYFYTEEIDANQMRMTAHITWSYRDEQRTMTLSTILYSYEDV